MANRRSLFRNFGDEETSDRPTVKINLLSDSSVVLPRALVVPGTSFLYIVYIHVKSTLWKIQIQYELVGIQGVVAKEWYTFGAKLKTPAHVFQLIKSVDAKTIDEICEISFGAVRDYFAAQEQFYIVGHSFGAIVALQLAQLLEQNGQNGRILLIDGSPIYLKRMSEAMVKTTSKKGCIEDVLIMLVFFNMCGGERTYKFTMELSKCDSWPRKMDLLYRHMPESIKNDYSSEYLYDLVRAMTNRLEAVIEMNVNAEPKCKLMSPITLVRPKLPSFTDIADDYGLSKYTNQPVDIRYIKGNHLTMLDGDEIAEIIDRFSPFE